MHRDNGTRLFGDFFFDAGRINIEEVGIDIDENRPGANPDDTAGRSKKRKRRRNDFVTGFHIQRHQADKQRIGCKCLILADLADRAGNFILDGGILNL